MSSRPNTIPGVSRTYIAGSEPEPEILTYITEGEKEEIQYLKGLEKLLKDNNKLKKLMVCVNDKIDESIVSCSHPLKRTDALLNYIKLNYPSRPSNMSLYTICDLDSGSFKTDEQLKLISISQNENINIILSNPAFQIWLVFHYYSPPFLPLSPKNLQYIFLCCIFCLILRLIMIFPVAAYIL